jgi:Family of unknown function (DUF6157)
MSGVNYYSTFIAVADDCDAGAGAEPPIKAKPTIARIQFEMVMEAPYEFTSEDVIFAASGAGQAVADLTDEEQSAAKAAYYAKPQACMRTSPLPKQYGWGIHHDEQGRVALFAVGSPEYKRFAGDPELKQLKALRSKRA